MSLAYYAAEYFIEAIGQSPSLSINYDYMTYLTRCAEGEIWRYLNDNGKGDIFFIFRKFPDVFCIKIGAISLTDAFLSIYALKRSTAPKGIRSSSSIKDYYENAAVTFFNTMVSRYGPQHYLKLFHLLVTQSNQMIASYFCRYTSSHAYSFFITHADAFVVRNCYVSLNIQSLIKARQQNTCDSPTVVKELTDSVYFLLTCFESLHYIELKQCISYVSEDVKYLLDQYSLIKQRRMFETLPNVKMDNYGFVSLLDLSVNISISNNTKLMLLFVCILTFERELHFQKMLTDIASGRSSVVNDLLNLSFDEQLQFFRSKSNYFYTTDRGFISLLPSYICPICSFEGLTKPVKKNQSYVKSEILCASPEVCAKSENSFEGITKHAKKEQSYIKSEILCTSPEVCGKSEKDSNHVDKKPEEVAAISSSKLNEIQQSANAPIIKVWTEMLNIDVSEEMKRQFIVSILFLSEVVEQIEHKYVLKTLLYVFYDVRISFDNLSETDKHDFIRSCCKIFNSELIKMIQLNQLLMKEIAEKKVLLFVTYLLTVKLCIHFEKIAKEIIVKNIAPLTSSISGQYKFFKTFSVLIEIGNDGYVKLAESFASVNSTVESYTDLISQHMQKDTLIQDKSSKCVSKAEKAAESNVATQPSSSTKKSVSPTGNKPSRRSRKKSQKLSTDSKLKQDVLQKLKYSSFLIRMHFKNALDSHIIEAYLLTFSDAYRFFRDLSFEGRYNFMEECYQLIKSSNDQLPSDNCCCNVLSQDLLCSYLIVREKIMHYQKIVTNLKNMNVDAILCDKTPSEQFKYFKSFGGYLEINGDGFVTLNPAFNDISSIINSVISFESRKSLKYKAVTEQKQPSCSSSQNVVRQVDLSVQGLSIAIENVNPSKNSPEKDDVKNLKMAQSSSINSVISFESRKSLRQVNLSTQGLSIAIENVNPSKNSPEKDDVKNLKMVQVNTTCTKNNNSYKKEIAEDSPNNLPLQNEWYIKDTVTDLCVFILSTCEKVSIEKLSCKLSSCDLRDVKNYFSILTYPEKLEFFKNLSKYFTVSVDGFISLKENVPNTYIPKTKISPSDVLCDSFSVLEESTNHAVQNKSECIMSTGSLTSEKKEKNSSCSKELKSSKSDCTESSPNECSNDFIEVRNSAKSALNFTVTMPGEVKNGSLAGQEKREVIYNPVPKNDTNVSLPNTSVASKGTPVVNISGPKSGFHHKSVGDIFEPSIQSTSQSFESNSCDTNSEKISKLKSKKELPNIDNFEMTLADEPNMFNRKSLEQVLDDFTYNDEKCTDHVLTIMSSFAKLSLNDSGEHNSTPLSQGVKYNFVNSVPQHTKSFDINESNIFLDSNIHKMSKLPLNYNSTRSVFDEISSSNENKLSTETKSGIGATSKQTVEDCPGLSSTLFLNDTIDGKILPSEEKIVPSLSTGNRNCNNILLSDLSHDAYIAEIIDSYLGNSKKEPIARKNSYFKNTSLNQNFQTIDTVQCSNNGSKRHDASSFSSDCQTLDGKNLNESISVSNISQCSSVSNNSDCSTSVNSIDLSECRAINFFCVMLENYKNSKEGVPVELLKQHLLLASSEVQSFMRSHFKDMLSFFRKHKGVFSVLPCSNVCLV